MTRGRVHTVGLVVAGALLWTGAARAQETAGYSVEGRVKLEIEAPVVRPEPRPAPPRAVVTAGQIEPFERVLFLSGTDAVEPGSLPALQAVAAVLEARPDIRQVRIEAHTDNVVSRNQRLSQRRADWVRRWLVAHGVDPARLVARGFGASRPVASNRTKEGRQANRRVEFLIRP